MTHGRNEVHVTIRPIELGDLAVAVTIIREGSFAPETENIDAADAYWAAVLETRVRRGDVLVAELEGEVVGVVQVMIFPHFQHTGGWCCELETFYVREDLRSQGIGAQLLVAAESFARERGCYRVQLTSRNYRVDAHRFYQTHGYDQGSQGFKKLLEG